MRRRLLAVTGTTPGRKATEGFDQARAPLAGALLLGQLVNFSDDATGRSDDSGDRFCVVGGPFRTVEPVGDLIERLLLARQGGPPDGRGGRGAPRAPLSSGRAMHDDRR